MIVLYFGLFGLLAFVLGAGILGMWLRQNRSKENGVLLALIPAHIFFLKYFEELELELRFGEAYCEYRYRTPFLIPKFSAR